MPACQSAQGAFSFAVVGEVSENGVGNAGSVEATLKSCGLRIVRSGSDRGVLLRLCHQPWRHLRLETSSAAPFDCVSHPKQLCF